MKKLLISLLIACLFLSITPGSLRANPDSLRVETTIPDAEKANKLLDRLQEINTMDKSNLTRKEKRKLRQEVRSTERKLRNIGGGIYISVGAVILIVILLIIFL